MKRRQRIETTQNKRKYMKPDINCFLCTRVGNEVDFMPIFSTKGKSEQLFEKIMIYTPFKVDENDNLQQKVCSMCMSELSNWHNFIQTCIEAQNKIYVISNNDCFQRNTKHRISDVSCDNASFESASTEGKHKPCNIQDEIIIPDKTVETASDCQNVECLSNAEIFIPKRPSLSTSLVTNTCLNNRNKRNFTTKPVNASSPINRTCSESEARGRYCIARWCGNNEKTFPGISLFRIPKDRGRAILWLTNAEREDLKTLSMDSLHTKYLCMEHFNDDMFMNSTKKKLVWNAMPMHFPKPNYAQRKEPISSHHQQKKSNVPKTTKQIISNICQPTRRRPLKPKPLIVELKPVAGLNSHPAICNAEEIKSVSETVSEVNSLASSSQCIQKEDCSLTEIGTGTLKMKRNDINPVPKCQVTSQLSPQGSRMLAIPNTNKFAPKFQEKMAHTRTANIILCSNLNEITDLKQENIETVTNTCEYLSLGNTDSVNRRDYHSDSSTVGDNKRNEHYTSVSDESYLNCDVESLCLEHAFRETNERIYPCRYCGEMFLVKSNLILHQTTFHSDHPVGCELCGKVLYKSRSEFMEHVCDHHSDNTYK